MTFSDSQRQLAKEIMASVALKVKIFCETGSPQLLEDEINKWIERQRLGPADIQKVTQSECGDNESGPVVRWKPSANFFTIGDIPLAIPIDKVDIRPNCQDWLTENLPETNPPASTRPGAEYGVDV